MSSVADELEDELELEQSLDETVSAKIHHQPDSLELDSLETADSLETPLEDKTEQVPQADEVSKVTFEEHEHSIQVEQDNTASNGNGKHDDEDVDMDALRTAALKSLGSKPREKETRDREGSRSQSPSGGESDGDDDLENMRRSLLAQRAEKVPGDLRAKLATKRKGNEDGQKGVRDTYYINPSPLKKQVSASLQFTLHRATGVDPLPNSSPILSRTTTITRPSPIVAPRVYTPLTITRTVKNEQARNPNAIIIDTRDSSDDEAEGTKQTDVQSIHIKTARKRRRSSRAVFQSASDIIVEDRDDDSLDEISDNDSGKNDSKTDSKKKKSKEKDGSNDELFIVKEDRPKGHKHRRSPKVQRRIERSPVRRSHSRSSRPEREVKHRSGGDRVVKERRSGEVKQRRSGNKDSSSDVKQRRSGDDELDKKMERIRRENQQRERKAKLIEYEKRKYGYK